MPSASSTRRSGAAGAHRRRQRRDDQARRNAFLATKISFINEIAMSARRRRERARGRARRRLDDRIGPKFLSAGIGYGGSCFTKDVSALKLLAATPATTSSCSRGDRGQRAAEAARRGQAHPPPRLARGQRIGLLGLAFKPNTDTCAAPPRWCCGAPGGRGRTRPAYDRSRPRRRSR